MGGLDVSVTRKQGKREECGKKKMAKKQDQNNYLMIFTSGTNKM